MYLIEESIVDEEINGYFVHEKINSVASYLVGVDYLQDDVAVIREKYGYEVYFADVTNIEDMRRGKDSIGNNVDVVVCDDLLRMCHLSMILM